MKFYKVKIILLTSVLVVGFLGTPAQAGDGVLFIAADHTEGYDRALFKLWVDADKNGCDTRAEVLIKEAIVKPKKGTNCKLTGGKWTSSYDGISYTNSSKLDIDHLVPLAEAWRSGAWAWTDKERETYANFLENDMALNAVTASVNRSKSDKDIASWLPKKNICQYLAGWATVKSYFNLTVDTAEAKIINKYYTSCGLGWVTKNSDTPIATQMPTTSATPTITPTPVITPSATPTPTPTVSTAPVITPTPAPIATSNSLLVTPGAFCAPAGAIGKSTSGVSYTCKTSPTDTRNRWRQ